MSVAWPEGYPIPTILVRTPRIDTLWPSEGVIIIARPPVVATELPAHVRGQATGKMARGTELVREICLLLMLLLLLLLLGHAKRVGEHAVQTC